MAKKLIWGITGAGDLLPQCFQVMEEIRDSGKWEITAALSKAAVKVVKFYKLNDRLEKIAQRVMEEKDANTPFLVAQLQTKKVDALVVAPLTANSAAKIALGLADSLLTNAVAQANKTDLPILLLPVDQKPGTVVTMMPSGGSLELTMREIDLENVERLRRMRGLTVCASPRDIALGLELLD